MSIIEFKKPKTKKIINQTDEEVRAAQELPNFNVYQMGQFIVTNVPTIGVFATLIIKDERV